MEGLVDQDERDAIDQQLGGAIRAWLGGRRRLDDVELDVQGPLPAPGMDPTWIVRMRAPWREAELFLFRGPHAEMAWFDPREAEPSVHLEGSDDLSPDSITLLLDRVFTTDGD